MGFRGSVPVIALLAGLWLFMAATPQARGEDEDPVTLAYRAVISQEGPEQYTALRRLWRMWENADPNDVEAALAQLAVSPKVDGDARAYAGLLHSYACECKSPA